MEVVEEVGKAVDAIEKRSEEELAAKVRVARGVSAGREEAVEVAGATGGKGVRAGIVTGIMLGLAMGLHQKATLAAMVHNVALVVPVVDKVVVISAHKMGRPHKAERGGGALVGVVAALAKPA